MSRVKSKRSFKENPTEDGVINSSTIAVPADSALVRGINSNTAAGGSSKRSRKKKSRYLESRILTSFCSLEFCLELLFPNYPVFYLAGFAVMINLRS